METRLRSWWQYIRKHWVATIIIVFLVVIVLIVLGYLFKWDWTGFNEQVGPNVQQYQARKTLWDWLNLLGVLAIPAVVGLGAAWYTAQQGKVSERENKDNQREVALQAYIDKMSELLLHEKLRDSAKEDEIRKVARVRTLTVLPSLDPIRKRNVLEFLYESGLIDMDKDKRIVDLSGANFSGTDLSGIHLSGVNLDHTILKGASLSRARFHSVRFDSADLSGADLSYSRFVFTHLFEADLTDANLRHTLFAETNLGQSTLSGADLTEAHLKGIYLGLAKLMRANLSNADLSNASLNQANLSGANLISANLQEADLHHANLMSTHVTMEQLNKAKSLQGATMPDGSIHD